LKNLLSVEYDNEVSFEFVEHECSFNAVYVRGSRYCDFRIRIYENTGKIGYLVEAQRLHKDSCGFTFKTVFNAIKRSIDQTYLSPTSTVDLSDISHSAAIDGIDFSSIELSTCSQLTDGEIAESIRQVLDMAREKSEQAQLEACRILCDLSDEPEIRQRMADTDCVKTLVDVLKCNRVLVQQHAVLALAQLSSCQKCVTAIIDAGAMPSLLSLACNGPYFTAAMRRESARIIANVAREKAAEAAMAVGQTELDAWSSRISDLNDVVIRERSQRANAYFRAVSI